MTYQLAKMIALATHRHDGQFDKGGQPYILHCLQVMQDVKSDDLEVKAIAVGHDLIEDTFDTVVEGLDFLQPLFTGRIVNGILALTKRGRGQSYEQYKMQVKINPDAVKVKMADLRHNSDPTRLAQLTAGDMTRLARYHAFYLELKGISQ